MSLTQKQTNDLKAILESLGLTIAAEDIKEIGYLVAKFVLASEASKSSFIKHLEKKE